MRFVISKKEPLPLPSPRTAASRSLYISEFLGDKAVSLPALEPAGAAVVVYLLECLGPGPRHSSACGTVELHPTLYVAGHPSSTSRSSATNSPTVRLFVSCSSPAFLLLSSHTLLNCSARINSTQLSTLVNPVTRPFIHSYLLPSTLVQHRVCPACLLSLLTRQSFSNQFESVLSTSISDQTHQPQVLSPGRNNPLCST